MAEIQNISIELVKVHPNDEEKGVVEGTSDLYVKKEGAK